MFLFSILQLGQTIYSYVDGGLYPYSVSHFSCRSRNVTCSCMSYFSIQSKHVAVTQDTHLKRSPPVWLAGRLQSRHRCWGHPLLTQADLSTSVSPYMGSMRQVACRANGHMGHWWWPWPSRRRLLTCLPSLSISVVTMTVCFRTFSWQCPHSWSCSSTR